MRQGERERERERERAYVGNSTEVDGAGFEPIQLIQATSVRHVADEMKHIVVVACHTLLIRHEWLGLGETIVRAADTLAVTDRHPCHAARGRESWKRGYASVELPRGNWWHSTGEAVHSASGPTGGSQGAPFSSAGNSMVNSLSLPTSSPKSTSGVFIRMESRACVAHALLITFTMQPAPPPGRMSLRAYTRSHRLKPSTSSGAGCYHPLSPGAEQRVCWWSRKEIKGVNSHSHLCNLSSLQAETTAQFPGKVAVKEP